MYIYIYIYAYCSRGQVREAIGALRKQEGRYAALLDRNTHVCIYIYIERERCIHIYIYTYYIHTICILYTYSSDDSYNNICIRGAAGQAAAGIVS